MTSSTATPNRLGVGLYSIPEAARLVGTYDGNIRRWIEPLTDLIPRTFPISEHTLSFLELMELHFIKMFRDSGVSLQTIRKAAKAAAKKFRVDYPFAVRRFDTDGKTIFATLLDREDDREAVEDLKRGQYVFTTILKPFFLKMDYRASREALRFWPQNKEGRVVLDPTRSFGKPIDSQTGVQTQALHEAVIANGGEMALVADWFDVPIEAVKSAVVFEESLARAA